MRAERVLLSLSISFVLGIGCGSTGSHANNASGDSEGGSPPGWSSGSGPGAGEDGGETSRGGGSPGNGSSDSGASSGTSGDAGSGTFPVAGNPSGSCTTLTLPAAAQAV